ncbi:Eco57I restriction-modification methylase domain-containing protein [Dellaglioa carnosa]|uniref:Eco57I restriction-modification methylase domain-containing protein n=1 Tax=Dellaglioa carnosa TaxID=2995136 RepID=A0ABT4JKU9_9LACO|nr:Eco57I restriction-modification methylase domain-containing protein [Dellaglioa carnosa]MCZ2490710.1 Eco57I restriction-modification methylase domain-containing protein [Dellaglioa carnosa]MCZ2493788.1 Eco57I restriction-modification methylase domain-containing protein [Dellaglioa carnosa]MDK1730652.1 Eco57I restriction-modification methylase domain-containing protein [Dellaglioa carnosa]
MKFDVVVGNPPYQESQSNNNKGEAIYHYFYDLSERVASKYCLISPARFLFNGGLTPKPWNHKMLNDEYLNVEYYVQNSRDVFQNTDIKGGIVVLYRDSKKKFGAINNFIPDETLRKIASKFDSKAENNLTTIMFGGRSDLKFNDKFLKRYPDSLKKRLEQIQRKHPEVLKLGSNEEYELKSSTFDSLDYAFFKGEPGNSENYWKILGIYNNERSYRWIEKEFMTARYPENNNLENYKVFVPESNGSGLMGEVLSTPLIGTPSTSNTPTFISIGSFNNEVEAQNLLKYVKTKFVRTLLGILKVTQHNPPLKWAYIPLQDFTLNSDIDWSKTIPEIDHYLYLKYGLGQNEINFIEGKVKEMN